MLRVRVQGLSLRLWPSILVVLALTHAIARASGIAAPPELPAVVDGIEIHGLWRTHPFVVRRELPWKPGEVVTPAEWILGVHRVWNIGVFSRVSAHLEIRGHRRIAVFDLEERWTIILIFRPSTGGGVSQVLAGVCDINTLGRYLQVGGYYQRFQQFNGWSAWVDNPRLFDRRLEGEISFDETVRPRPQFSLARLHAELDVIQEVRDDLHYGGRLEFMADRFLPPLTGQEFAPTPSRTTQLGGMYRQGIVNTIRIRQEGLSPELRPSLALTSANVPASRLYVSLGVQWLWFKMVGARWNFACRSLAGAMSPSQPQQHYFLGGLDMIRGFPDNEIETRLYAVTNLEARFTAFDSTWLALQPVAFADGALARDEQTGRARGALSAGLGLRFLCPRIVRSGVRIDGALPLAPFGRVALSAGVYQFF